MVPVQGGPTGFYTVFYMLFERCYSNSRKGSIKQNTLSIITCNLCKKKAFGAPCIVPPEAVEVDLELLDGHDDLVPLHTRLSEDPLAQGNLTFSR